MYFFNIKYIIHKWEGSNANKYKGYYYINSKRANIANPGGEYNTPQ